MNKSAIISRLEQQCRNTLLTLLDDMFASCDDLFFDLASRATTNSEQNLYFESMREVRVRTRSAREDYESGLNSLFSAAQKQQPHNKAAKKSDDDQNSENLKLVDKDDVEQDVAVSAMTSRAAAVSKNPLFELCSRLSVLYQFEVNDDSNPLDPGSLIALFADAIQPMGIKIKARIILLKQYERYIVNRLPELYQKTNALLQEQGIAFNKQRKIKKQASQARPPSSSKPFGNLLDDDEFELPLLSNGYEPSYRYGSPAFSDLTQLLSSLRSIPSQALENEVPMFSSGSGAMVHNNELINLLDTAPSFDYDQASALGLRSYIRQILAQGQPKGQSRSVQQVDEDVINLVAMFFDFVLDDKSIPDSVKTLVSRLQMPILKIALKDKRFFSDTDHPAREFINEVARISIGVDEEGIGGEDLLEKIEQWVQDIQTNAEDLEIAFTDALKELKAYSKQSEKRADLVQKRTSEAVQGQAKKQVATLRSQRAIQEAMDGKSVAIPISEFIVKHWQQVLYVTFVKEGEESQGWLAQLQTMQDLIWCSSPHNDEKSRQRLDRITEDLFDKLSIGLKQTTLNEQQISGQVQQLESWLEKIAEPENVEIEVGTFEASSDEALQSLQKQKGWKEMTALERQKVQFQALTYEFIERAEAITLGSWLEFKEPATGSILRCKLAAKLEGSDNYVFVNRLGFKAIEKPRKEFAFDLQRKRARLLRTGPLFDRSLHKMVSSLRKIAN